MYVIIQERAYFLIVGRQDELEEPGMRGYGPISEPVDVKTRLVRLRENGDDDTRLSE